MRSLFTLYAIMCSFFLASFVGCDTGKIAEITDIQYKEVQLDTKLIQKAQDLLSKQNTLTSMQFELEKPKYTVINVEKPLLRFVNEEAFGETVKALRVISLFEKKPMEIAETLKNYAQYEEPVLSIAELSVLDNQGRVVIGNKLYDLTEGKTIVSDLNTHKIIETITPETPQWTSAFKTSTITQKSKGQNGANVLSDPINGCDTGDSDCRSEFSDIVSKLATNGYYKRVKALKFHDAWKSFFRTKTMVYTGFFFQENDGAWTTLNSLSSFYGGELKADITFRRGSGCPLWDSPVYSTTTDGSVCEDFNYRCANTDPHASYHTAILGGTIFFLNEVLIGNGYQTNSSH